MMDDGVIFWIVFSVGVVVGGCLFGFPVGREVGENSIRKEAISNNAAHYVLDGENGGTKFVWGPRP